MRLRQPWPRVVRNPMLRRLMAQSMFQAVARSKQARSLRQRLSARTRTICTAAWRDFRGQDMPRPLKVKIFMDKSAGVVEEQVNTWLASQTAANIIKTET